MPSIAAAMALALVGLASGHVAALVAGTLIFFALVMLAVSDRRRQEGRGR